MKRLKPSILGVLVILLFLTLTGCGRPMAPGDNQDQQDQVTASEQTVQDQQEEQNEGLTIDAIPRPPFTLIFKF